MLHLIKKDILMQKRSLALSFVLMIFFTVTFSNVGPIGLAIAILAITYQLALGASALEDKNNSDVILISFPIKKEIIVLAKYLSIFVYTIYATIGYSLISLLVKVLPISYEVPLTLLSVVIAIAYVMLYFSLTFPLIFRYGYLKSKIPNLIIFFVLVFGGSALLANISQNSEFNWSQSIMEFISALSPVGLGLVMLVPLLVLLVVSYFVSLGFYKRREF